MSLNRSVYNIATTAKTVRKGGKINKVRELRFEPSYVAAATTAGFSSSVLGSSFPLLAIFSSIS